MTPERWERVQELFYGAEEMTGSGRLNWLKAQCEGDAELEREVRKLLHSAVTDSGVLEESILATASEMLTVESVGEGGKLGPYELVRKLGQGGMGLVYLARRADRQYEQEVAIKLIQAFLGNQELLLRFRTERQILAQLSHPNIAKLLDGGVTQNGQPYLVMEYIDGPRIDEYCRKNEFNVTAKLDMFRKICAGVQAAHQSLVVHRDIKPANILVTSDGTPKLLDFGIAKLLVPGQMGQTVAQTRHSERLMTVEYASPEQIRGEVITTATDVYSLGVLLYELLTGVKPFEHRTTVGELETRVLEEDPARPSTRSGRRLDSDLDNIVLKAMHKDATRRYATAAELSEDVRRYLEGFPVLAQADSFRYRAGKFVRRHRWGVGASAVFAATILMFGIGLANFANKARVERDRAEQVSQFLIDLFQTPDPENARGRTITAREMLDKGVGQVSKLEAQPEVKTKLLRTFGLVYENLGEYGKSRALLGDGLKLARQTYGGETEDAAMLEKALAELARRAGSFDEAERLAKQSLATRRKVLGTKSAFTAESLNTVALTLFDKAEFKQAEPYFQELLGMRPTLRERPHLETAVLSNAGALYQNLGENARAEELLRECIAIRRRELGNLHPRLGLALTKLASVMLSMNRLDEAAGMQLEALAIYKKVHGQFHPDVARTLSGLGRTRTEQGRFEEAEQFLTEAQTVIDKTVGDKDRDAAALYLKGQLRVAQKRWTDAEAAFRQARAVREKAVGPGHVNTARAVMALSLVLLEEGKAEEARALFEEARKVLDEKLKAKVERGEFLEAAARFAEVKGDSGEARRLWGEALAAYRGGLAGKHPKIGQLEMRLARN